MKYIEYIDFPKVPEYLLESIQEIIDKPSKSASSVPSDYLYFKSKYVTTELKDWLQSLFDFEIYPQYQLVYNGLPIHIDNGNRVFAYNYLLDTGGDNVRTIIYNEKYIPIQIESIQLKKWHRINTSMLHGVHGIDPNKIRIALSIGAYTL